jgi:tetratricopeptide (TPR) repeat protein
VATALQERLQSVVGDAYQIERELTPGGMSRLFLALEPSLDRRVVIKLLPPEFANETSAQRFQREMQVTAKLQHAHILPVLTANVRDGLLYYITPYVAGESLRKRLAAEQPLTLDESIRLLREVALALAFAHERGVVHRDLKPDNIFLQHGHAILADFGIARAVEQAARTGAAERLTGTGLGMGTPGYMAPEQLAGDPNVDSRADIYAMGLVAYEMLAGQPPFHGLTGAKLMIAHMTRPPEPVTEYAVSTPPILAELVMRCLEKDPSERWQTVDEVIPTLEELVVWTGARPSGRDGHDRVTPSGAATGVGSMSSQLRAGLEAFERREWHEAFDALSAADAVTPLSPAHLEHLAEAAWWIGKSDECIKTRERAYARYLESGNLARAAAVAIAVGEDYFHKLSRSVAHGWLQRAQRHLDGVPECIEHGWMARTRAMLALEEDRDVEKAWALAEQARDIATRMGDRNLQTLALQDCGRILVSKGRVADGMAAIDEAMAITSSGQLGPRTTGRILCNMMSTCEKLADYRRAGEWNQAARQWCEPHAQSGYPGICRVHRAQLLRLRGEWPEAEEEARHASTELKDFLGDVAGEAYYELGEIRLRMGDLPAAEGLFRQAHELGRDPMPGMALLRLAQGKTDSAQALIERALSDSLLSPLDRARLLPVQAEVALATGSVDSARSAAAELQSITETYDSPALAAHAAYARGVVDMNDGRPAAAAINLRRAWRLSKDSDLPYEAARARVLLGRAYLAAGNKEDAELELQAAASSFERLGAAADARSAAALLEA